MKFYAGIGSRSTPEDVLDLMHALAVKLRDDGWVLRSGGARGADTAFAAGAGHARIIYRPDNAGEIEFNVARQYHPAWDRCDGWARALHARNVLQVLGQGIGLADFIEFPEPSTFVVCWTKDGQASGGTGQAIRIAEAYGIPVRNLHDPTTREAAERFVKGE